MRSLEFWRQNKVLEAPIIIINSSIIVVITIIINSYYNYTNNINYNYYISNEVLPEECDEEENVATGGCFYFLFENKTVKHFVQSPPGRRPIDKYPVSTSHHIKMFQSQYYMVVTVIHTQSLRSHMCVYVHMFTLYRRWMDPPQKKKKEKKSSECR